MKNLFLYFQAHQLKKKEQWEKAAAIYKRLATKTEDKAGKLAYSQGIIAEKLKNWKTAEYYLRQAVEKQPGNAQWIYHLGLSLEYGKKYAEAITVFETALALKPEQPYCLRHLGKVLMLIGNFAAAEDPLRKAIKLVPHNAIFWNDLILVIRKQGCTWQEVEVLQQALALDAGNAQWQFELGEAQDKMNRFSEAAQTFAQANAIQPGNAMWHFREGWAWERADQGKQAQAAYNAAIAADQDLKAQTLGIGVFHQQRGFWPQAAEAYAKEIEIQPHNAELHYCLGLAHDRCYRWEQATQCYRQALALDVTNVDWHYRLGFVLERQQQWQKAAEAYEYAVITRAKHTPYWFYRLGYVLSQAGQYEEACSAFLHIHTQAELDVLFMVQQANTPAVQTGLSERYIQDLKDNLRTLQIQDGALYSNDWAAAFYKLGNQAERLQMWKEAAQAYENAISHKQNPVAAWNYRLGYCLLREGDFQKSVSAYKEMDLLAGFRNRINNDFFIEILDIKTEENKFIFSLYFKNKSKINGDIRIKNLVLLHRRRIGNEDTEIYAENNTLVSTHEGWVDFEFSIEKLDLHYWDIYADVEVFDKNYGDVIVRIHNKKIRFLQNLLGRVEGNPYAYSISIFENIIIPHINTPRTKIALLKRPVTGYDDSVYIEREQQARKEYLQNKDELDARKSWLIFEKFSKTAQDNAFYFFLYAVKKRPYVYFVIEKNSPDRKKLIGHEENVVEFMSIEHMKLLLACETIISSENRGHGYAWWRIFGEYKTSLLDKKFIFLQHGVITFKKIDRIYKKTNKAFAADKFIASNNMEVKFIIDNFGYEKDDLIISGLPRWDSLQNDFPETDEIFLMPTWRNWLEDMSEEKFLETDYFKNYMNLLTSEALCECLNKFNIKLNFYLHPKILEHLDKFKIKSEYIKIIDFGEFSIRELLQRAKLLVTDYSSVAWDCIYLGKPVLFYHFDIDMYEKYQGAYINLKTDLPGKVAYNEQELIALLEDQLRNISSINTEALNMKNKYFPNIAGNACETIYQALVEE